MKKTTFPKRLHVYQLNLAYEVVVEKPDGKSLGAAVTMEDGEPIALYELVSEGTLRVKRDYAAMEKKR